MDRLIDGVGAECCIRIRTSLGAQIRQSVRWAWSHQTEGSANSHGFDLMETPSERWCMRRMLDEAKNKLG
ncbi:MAG: hypothetical protein MK198_10920 [Gracilimonas sp.]|uniref:hypothetical protein n=1 Tax=Gracilimonas sp. TaxID=1974203 RepID=UPI0037500A8C|nr:hypothetical protein [Gracilimonas sp.]